jgi:hypothetical protein
MKSIIERLDREKAESQVKYKEEGRISGIAWANSAHYRELKKVVAKKIEIVDFYDRNGGVPYDEIEISENIHKNITDVFAADPLLGNFVDGAELVLGSCLSEEATEWFLGWLDGAEEVWSKISGEL